MNIEEFRKEMKDKHRYIKNNNIDSNKLYNSLIKLMILIIMFIGSLIYVKTSDDNKQKMYDLLFKDNISFSKINNLYNEYLGDVLPFKGLVSDTKPVFNERLEYSSANIYKDGVALNVSDSYLVPAIGEGIVIFVGEKEGYGKTVIVEQSDGVNVWYSNLINLNVNIYDYIEEGNLIGETKDNILYLVFKKEEKVLDYKEFIS